MKRKCIDVLKTLAGLLLLTAALPLAATVLEEDVSSFSPKTVLQECPIPAVQLHVTPEGDDSASGTTEAPLATLEAARDRLRQLKKEGKLGAGGAQVVVHGGLYPVSQTFTLSEEDSGTATAPVRYCGAEGESPVFTGGLRLEDFTPVTDKEVLKRIPKEARKSVLQLDLAKYGVKDLPPLELGGFCSGRGFFTHPVMELFFDGEAMTLSRWPNEGFVEVKDIVVRDGLKRHGREGSWVGRIKYKGRRPKRWIGEEAPFLYGYWFWGWADSYEPVASINTRKRQIQFKEPYSNYGYRAGTPYYALNLLSEIDVPGEWYLSRKTGILYFYPPAQLEGALVELSVLNMPLLKLDGVSHTLFQGITWELGGADAVQIQNGEYCTLAGCTVRRCGGNGICVNGGKKHTLLSCNIFSMGRGGIDMDAGDRKTLRPSEHLIENCDIHELSRVDHTYTPAIHMVGVGNRIARNRLHDIPSSAIRLDGNDHMVELNEVFNVVLESDDQGGADMWGSATYRGNVYRYNYWHHIGPQGESLEDVECGRAGIRLDDKISGTRLYGNIFYRASAGKTGFGGVQVHGGKDNLIDNNVFLECMAALSFSTWGDERWRKSIENELKEKDIDPGLYLQRYPELKELADYHDRNYVRQNLVLNCSEFIRRQKEEIQVSDNVVTNMNLSPLKDGNGKLILEKFPTLLEKKGLATIPVTEIGLYETPLRVSKQH